MDEEGDTVVKSRKVAIFDSLDSLMSSKEDTSLFYYSVEVGVYYTQEKIDEWLVSKS